MPIEPISLELGRPSPASLQGIDDRLGFLDGSVFDPSPLSAALSDHVSGRIQQLIEELKWENDRLLIHPRNSAPASRAFEESNSVLDGFASLRADLLTAQNAAVQANALPATVLGLLQ